MSTLLLRQASGTPGEIRGQCYLCHDLVKSAPGNLRLGCGCLIHLSCLTSYVKSTVNDPSNEYRVRKWRGFSCPFYSESEIASECALSDRYILCKDDIECMIQFASSPLSAGPSTMRLSRDQLELYKRMGVPAPKSTPTPATPVTKTNEEQLESLTVNELERVSSWLDGTPMPTPPSDGNVTDPFVKATSKKCPNPDCLATVEHFHGHSCHHITCGGCRTEMCFRCLSTAEENMRERHQKERCKCPGGSWTNFCEPFTSVEDIDMFLGKNEFGYPIDTRCGCAICPTCRPLSRCGKESCSFRGDSDERIPRCLGCEFECSVCERSDCSVCKGHTNPGPTDIAHLSTWVAQTEEQKERLSNYIHSVEQPGLLLLHTLLRAFFQDALVEQPEATGRDDVMRIQFEFQTGGEEVAHCHHCAGGPWECACDACPRLPQSLCQRDIPRDVPRTAPLLPHQATLRGSGGGRGVVDTRRGEDGEGSESESSASKLVYKGVEFVPKGFNP